MWQRSLITDEIWCNFWSLSCVWFKQSCPLDQNYTGATTFSITTINIMTHNIMACSIRTLTIPIKIHDTQHNNTRCWVSISWGSHLYNVYDVCSYAECSYVDCHGTTFGSEKTIQAFRKPFLFTLLCPFKAR